MSMNQPTRRSKKYKHYWKNEPKGEPGAHILEDYIFYEIFCFLFFSDIEFEIYHLLGPEGVKKMKFKCVLIVN